jgi:beta-lactamase class D
MNFNAPRLATLLPVIMILISACSVNKATIDNDLKKYFEEKKAEGCFTMLNNSTGEVTVYNMSLDTAKVFPGNTFHILNAMVALENGIIPNENTILPFDSITHLNNPGLNDMNVVTAFQRNQSLFFEMLARKTGSAKMQDWINKVGYGNKRINKDTTNYWDHTLLISPDEQLGLLKRMYFNQLPFRQSVQESVKSMLIKENNAAYTLAYQVANLKTVDGRQQAWVMGWIEENKHVYFFVTYAKFSSASADVNKSSMELTQRILGHYGFFKGEK